jgi:hypothetical protein
LLDELFEHPDENGVGGDTSARESVANPDGQYSELAVLALRWAMAFRITGCRKTISAQRNFKGMHFWDKSRTPPQDSRASTRDWRDGRGFEV